MLSEQGQNIKNWLIHNLKNVPPATTVLEARERLEMLAGEGLPEGIEIQSVAENGVKGEWIKSGSVVDSKVVVYFHGGGFIMGSLKSSRGLAILLSQVTQCPVFSVDYRLAPENPFPAALDDAVAVYYWLENKGFLAENLAFVGDSAGSGLALSAISVLKNNHRKLPGVVGLITPWLDLLGTGQSRKTKQDSDPWYNPDSIELQAGRIYAGENDLGNPLISPFYADITGFPPILIQAAGEDTLVDDSLQFYEKWKGTGVEITLEYWEEMWHVWHHFAGQLPEAQEALSQLGQFIKEKMRI